VLAKNPEMTAANDALSRLAHELHQRKIAGVNANVATVQGYWDKLEAATRASHGADEITPEVLAQMAVAARLAIMRGDIKRHLSVEKRRARRTRSYLKKEGNPGDVEKAGGSTGKAYKKAFAAEIGRLKAAHASPTTCGLDGRGSGGKVIPVYPVMIDEHIARVLVATGQFDTAFKLRTALYQSGYGGHPGSFIKKFDATRSVQIAEQEYRRVEKVGDPKAIAQAAKTLASLVKTAQKQQANHQAYTAGLAALKKIMKISSGRDGVVQIREEGKFARKVPNHLRLSEYQRFVQRFDQGYYAAQLDSKEIAGWDDFRSLAKTWRGIAKFGWRDAVPTACTAPQVSHLVKYQEMVAFDAPRRASDKKTNEEIQLRQQEELSNLINKVYKP
jgi:hypothetical protein